MRIQYAFYALAGVLAAGLSPAFETTGHFWENATMDYSTGDLCDRGNFPLTPGDCSGTPEATFTSFEFAANGPFDVGTSPFTATFSSGTAQTVGNPALYVTGAFAWHVSGGDTADVTFESAPAELNFWARTQDNNASGTLTVFDTDNVQIFQTAVPAAYQQFNISRTASQSRIGRLEVDSTGVNDVVVDDLTFTVNNPNWSNEFVTSLGRWNNATSVFNFTDNPAAVTTDCSLGDFNNPNPSSSFFDNVACGQAFGAQTLAVSITTFAVEGRALRNDIVFNTAFDWDAYDGAVGNTIDFRRVSVHEQGHTGGLGHPVVPDNPEPIMDATVGNTIIPQPDDLVGLDYVYGLRDNDMDGDLNHDVFLRRSDDGRWFLYRLNGQVIESSDSVALTTNLIWQVMAIKNFDGEDGVDVLVRRTDNGNWFMYTMDGPMVTSSGAVDMATAAVWELVAADDFNGDGNCDVLLRRTDNGRWRMYLLNGQMIIGTELVDIVSNLDWVVVATGDFNRDGNADVLVRNTINGRWRIYMMNGTMVDSTDLVNIATNLVWQAVAVKDFTADGRPDVLVRRTDNGRWRMYVLDGTTVTETALINLPASLAWALQSTADFNFDGRRDALVRNMNNGRWRLYLLDGTTILENALVALTTNLNWTTQATGDLDKDRRADVLIRNGANGRWFVYTLEGTTIECSGNVDLTTNLAWEVIFTQSH